ncbi:Fic family protein, partial [Gillisia limnaea]
PQVTPQVTPQVQELLNAFTGEHSRTELQNELSLLDRENFRINYLVPAIENGFVELTIPDKPKSSKQKYRLTQEGKKARQE